MRYASAKIDHAEKRKLPQYFLIFSEETKVENLKETYIIRSEELKTIEASSFRSILTLMLHFGQIASKKLTTN